MYKKPLTLKEIKALYPDKYEILSNDPVHYFRATTGIELIHKEPSREEQKRIWNNWVEMSTEQKRLSDEKSIELFGISNEEYQKQIEKGFI